MSELLPLKNEKEEEKYDYYNNILILKESIKSDIIKKMLEEEDIKEKEDKNINNIIIKKNSNKKKTHNNKENKDKNNLNYFPLIKIYPKSRTIKNLLIEKPKKNLLKTNQKKKINEKEEKEEKTNINKNSKFILKTENNNLNTMLDNQDNKSNSKEKYFGKIDIIQRNLSPNIQKQKIQFINEDIKDNIKKEIYHSEEKPKREKPEFFITNESISINKDEKSQKYKDKINKAKKSLYDEINLNLKNIYNNNDIMKEKNLQDFEKFISENDTFEFNYSPKIQKALNTFKKGNKFIKKYLYLPKCPKYSPQEIIKHLIFKDILSFLSPIERYVFSKTNKESLVNYMKSKGAEFEIILDKYKNQKEQIEKILNKNQNIKITKENFFNDSRLIQIFNLLDDSKYLEIFNDKTKVPDDNIIFVFKLFFLLIKGTDKLVELKNDAFWEKISTYFINHTNEFNSNDYLLGELIKKILEQKIDFSEAKIQKIHGIIDQVDLRQINPATFKDISPTTSQFCYIIGYFMEFFDIIDKEWNPLETEYKELNEKINELIKKINKIGLYIVNLKYKSQFK